MSHWEFQSCGAISFGGRIADVEELTELPDEEAIAKAHALFSKRKHLFDGFELWEGVRVLIGHPQRRRAARGPLLDRARQDERRNSHQSQRKACEIRVRAPGFRQKCQSLGLSASGR
jgi:hypothetical protein